MLDVLSASALVTAGTVIGGGILAGSVVRLRRAVSHHSALRQRVDQIERLVYTPHPIDDPTPERIPAPPFSLPGTDGAPVSLDRLRALGKPVMLVFTDPTGVTGRNLVETIGSWQLEHASPVTTVVIGPKDMQERGSVTVPPGITAVAAQDGTVSRDYGIVLTPAIILVGPNGAIAGPPTVGVAGIQTLLTSLAKAAAHAQVQRKAQAVSGTPPVNTPAPLVILDSLDGEPQQILLPAQPQVLLFWSPRCGYCNQLAPDLRAWDGAASEKMPPITLVARGSVEDNRNEQLGFRTLLDDDLSASTAYGVTSTPSAILIDNQGRISSPMARGIREVRQLLALEDPGPSQQTAHRPAAVPAPVITR